MVMKSLKGPMVGKNIVDNVSARAEEDVWRPRWKRHAFAFALLVIFYMEEEAPLGCLWTNAQGPVHGSLNHPHQSKDRCEWRENLEGFVFGPKPSAKLNFGLCKFQPGPKLISTSPLLEKRSILYPSKNHVPLVECLRTQISLKAFLWS